MAQHLEYCSPCKPQQLLNLLEHRTREKTEADRVIDALQAEVLNLREQRTREKTEADRVIKSLKEEAFLLSFTSMS